MAAKIDRFYFTFLSIGLIFSVAGLIHSLLGAGCQDVKQVISIE